jgi:hypothetical protein
LDPGLYAYKEGTLLYEPRLQSTLLLCFCRCGLQIYLPRQASNCSHLDLSSPTRYNYRSEPPMPDRRGILRHRIPESSRFDVQLSLWPSTLSHYTFIDYPVTLNSDLLIIHIRLLFPLLGPPNHKQDWCHKQIS